MSKQKAPAKWGRNAHWINRKKPSKFLRNREAAYKIPKKLGIHLTPELDKKFRDLVAHFRFEYVQEFELTTPELRVLMENIRDGAGAFIQALDGIRHPAIKRVLDLPPMEKADSSIRELMGRASAWQNAAEKAIPKKGKTGPKRNQNLAAFIIDLADIYEGATGEEARPGYYDRDKQEIVGEFSRFVEAVLNRMGKGVSQSIYQSPRSLIETDITQALLSRPSK